MKLRPVEGKDCQLLFGWVNDPTVRSAAFSSDYIDWKSHCRWFSQHLQNDRCLMYIALDDKEQEEPIGQIRFDQLSPNAVEIDVSVDSAKRTQGVGTDLIIAGAERFFSESTISAIHAWVKSGNAASRKVFEKANFQGVGIEVVQGVECEHFLLERHKGEGWDN